MSEPVKYWKNGNVRFPATYAALLKECERLQAENQRLKEAFVDCMRHVQVDNLTMQAKQREWEAALYPEEVRNE